MSNLPTVGLPICLQPDQAKVELVEEPYNRIMKQEYDEVRSVDCKNGITWLYMKNNETLDTAFVTWKALYYIQINN